MKKLIFAIASLCVATSLNAQFTASFGYLSTNKVKTVSEFGGYMNEITNSGVYAGLLYDFRLKNAIIKGCAIETGLTYSYLSGSSDGITTDYHTISVPIKIKYRYSFNNDRTAVFGLFGPQLSFGLAATEDGSENHSGADDASMYDDTINRYNMTIGIGVGVELMKYLEFHLSYDYGLTDVSAIEGYETRINYINVGMGILF
ncbi:MAG: porin family protein [Prevotella sp.]